MKNLQKADAAKSKVLKNGGRLAVRSDKKTADSPDFGVEGTNKTIAEPQAESVARHDLAANTGKSIPKSPHIRGGS